MPQVYRSATGKEKMLECGCTATVVVVQGGCVCLADVGDSLAALGHDDEEGGGRYTGEFITRRHHGRDLEEAERIHTSCGAKTQVLEDGYIHVAEGPFTGYELAVTR
jgi:serine/threonine protein phosphatase PrpC